jgi:Ca-activated chloride channel family protein
MKRTFVLVPALLLIMLVMVGCGAAERLNNEGNEAFANQDYEGALLAYHKAGTESPELAEPHYNAANSHYRLEDYEQAQKELEQALVNEESLQDLDQSSFYNLGNTFFQAGQFEMAIEAYKEALRLNPGDLEAKQNLELALRQLHQEQQEDQQNQQNQDQQDQQNQDQQDQQNQDQQDQQNQDQQDQQNQDQQDQQNQDQQDQQNQDQQDQDQQDQQNQDQRKNGQPNDREQSGQANKQPQQVAGLSKEQARQLLDAAARGTESLEEFLQQILVFPGAPPAEDW